MHNDLLIGIAMVIGLGMLAQWVAWRIRLPSIVFLLLTGLGVGPIATKLLGSPILDVDHLMGDLLFPIVSASVAVILFEGGMNLRLSDIRGSGRVVGNLVTLGAVASWLVTSVAAFYILDFSVGLALLLGATLVVTGPTVVIPLLKQIRPTGRVGSILRWEGIVIDPIGAILAVLVFEEILGGPPFFNAVWSLVKTTIIGLVIGWIAAQIIIEFIRRYWVPDTLQNPITLGIVLTAFALSNVLMPESGLLTVTVMGILMANQRRIDIRHIIEFKETLQILLLSSLFILLAARMQPTDLTSIGWPTLGFVVFVIFIQRPLTVIVSTFNSNLNWRERIFLSWMAPRGIVAASVASVFALELVDHGNAEGAALIPVTFAVIIGTVLIYSFTSGILARRLGLAERDPQGLLIVGASRWIIDAALEVQKSGIRVILVDTNMANTESALKNGIEVYHGNILSEHAREEISLGGIGRLLALTPNLEVNALAAENYESTFGSDSVYELQRQNTGHEREMMAHHLGGRYLFPDTFTFEKLEYRYRCGARVLTIEVDNVVELQKCIPDAVIPLFVLSGDNQFSIWTLEDPPVIASGNRIIALVESEQYEELLERKAILPREGDHDTRVFPEIVMET